MSKRKRSVGGEVEMNMTPMIDVTFQLILFFILAGQVASEALAKMELTQPHQSQAIKEDDATTSLKMIINIISKGAVDENADPYIAGKVLRYQIGTQRISPGNEQKIVEILEDMLEPLTKEQREKQFFVEIRADKRVHFSGVEPVLTAATEAGVKRMNLTALIQTQ